MKRITLLFYLSLFPIISNAQKPEVDRVDWIFWQEDRPLRFEDFQGPIGACGPETFEDSIYIEVSACLGIWTVLDIPKTWKKGVEYEKFYFVPVFNKQKSWAKSNDSIAILKQQVFFDMSELAARWARKELYRMREKAGNPTGLTAIYFSTIKRDMEEFKQGMFSSYFNDVMRGNNLDSLQGWADFTQEMLDDFEDYKTQEIEFERLITGKSEKGYKKAKSIIGPLGDRKDNSN